MKHFIFYPKIEYSNHESINITVRAKIKDLIMLKEAAAYKYFLKETDTPESISKQYYGNSNYVWAIYYANDIFHPILDWTKDHNTFNKYIEKKYGSFSEATTKIHHYEYHDLENRKIYNIDKITYDNFLAQENVNSASNRETVKSITFYDHEFKENEKKKYVLILDKSELFVLVNNLQNIFK